MSSETNSAKLQAARSAAELVQDGMVVGLGTGSTAALLVQRLGERVAQEGLKIVAVATSVATADAARALNIPLQDLDEVPALDINIDGADEVDPQYRLIKGRGGALLREKIVACAAKKRVTIVSPDKIVDRLGVGAPLPIEVSPIGVKHAEKRLQKLGAKTTIRAGEGGATFVTDGGNYIIDCRFSGIDDPEALDAQLQSVVGVFETGLFLGLCDVLIIGKPDGAQRIETKAHRWPGCV